MEINAITKPDYSRTEPPTVSRSDVPEQKPSEQPPQDEYIPESKDRKPSGLYYLTHDKAGKPKIEYEDPKKARDTDADKNTNPDQKKVSGQMAPGNPEEDCTTNTDAVDREIEKLKEQKKQLEQQLRAAAGDEKKEAKLQKELAQVEGELAQKNNDSYRKQHSVQENL